MFKKPVKYIFIGNPHSTKSTLTKKLFENDEIFETDGLKKEEIYNIDKFNLNSKVVVIGGRYYKRFYQKLYILYKLRKSLYKYSLIYVFFHRNENEIKKPIKRRKDYE